MQVAFTLDSPLGRAIAQYTGRTVVALDVQADPLVRNVYAVRATIKPVIPKGSPYPIDFLVKLPLLLALSVTVIEEALEETEFTAWPPVGRF